MAGSVEVEITGHAIRMGAGQSSIATTPSGTLEEAAQRIRELDQRARTIAVSAKDKMEAALDAAFWCGQWLTYAKSKVAHGQWLPWLETVGIQQRTAHRYMSLANQTDRSNLMLSARNLTHAMELAGVRKPESHKTDESERHTAKRVPETLESISLQFNRWKKAQFEPCLADANDELLCIWEAKLKPMHKAYLAVCEKLRSGK